MIDRRHFVASLAAASLLPACKGKVIPLADADGLAKSLFALARQAGGRLGVCLQDTGSGVTAGLNQNQRFALCSTFKLSLAALVLREAAAGRVSLGDTISYGRADLLGHSPETEKHVAEGKMTIGALAEAAQLVSDNAAANLLLKRFGGPAGLTAFWRAIGDEETRLDNFEPKLNHVAPGETHDTTTPEAMARGVARLLTGDVLPPAERARLADWMQRTTTGMKRIRAGVPAGWRAGDKTGTANYPDLATRINDIAVLTPPGGRAPLVVTAFYETAAPTDTIRAEDEAVLAEVGKVVVAWAAASAKGTG